MSIPGLGGGSGSQNVTQTQYSREAPDIEARRVQLMDTAAKLAAEGKKPTAGDITIPTQGVAKMDPMQAQVFGRRLDAQGQPIAEGDPSHWKQSMLYKGLGTYQPFLNQATAQTLGSTAAYDPSTAYQQYMNPYQSHVTQGIEDQFAKLQNQAAAQGVQTGAFGGARQGVQTAELGAQQAQAVGQSLAQNYGQAQQQAQQQFTSQMGRQAQAGQQLAGLGQYQQQLQQGDIASLMAAGATQQQQGQQLLDAQYRQQLQQIYEPYQRMGFVSDIYQGAPSSQMALSQGTAPTTNPLAQGIGAGITGLAAYQGFQNMTG
jgi:hypothetical protein